MPSQSGARGAGAGRASTPAFAKIDERAIRQLKSASRAGGLAGLVGGTQSAAGNANKVANSIFSQSAPGSIVGAPDPIGAFGSIAALDGGTAGAQRSGVNRKRDDDQRTDVTITLRSYHQGRAPVYGDFDHAYVQIEVEGSGEPHILRAGPSEKYENFSTSEQALSGSPVKGEFGEVITLFAQLNLAGESPDSPGNHPIIASSFRFASLNDVLAIARRVARAYNNRASVYKPLTLNSNTFARDAFELVGAREYFDSIPRLPGSARNTGRKIP